MGIVVSTPFLGGPKSWSKSRQGLLHTTLAAADLLAVAWMVSLYTFQVRTTTYLLLHSHHIAEDDSLMSLGEHVITQKHESEDLIINQQLESF